ncbi:MAG: hypothetical protein OXI54_12385 [Chloroflexota bacterium]|nr:hypothetical protein [Chloroflexota bacterium]MDE2684930.1 hypothetical protein [Chloroflexota bacterium]
MQDNFDDALGDAAHALAGPRGPLPPGVHRVVVLYGDTANLARAVEEADMRVVFAHFQLDGEAIDDAAIPDMTPEFDLLCANIPTGEETRAFQFALQYIQIWQPPGFLLVTSGASSLLSALRETTRPMNYRTSVHVIGKRTFIVGMQDDADDTMKTALWEVAHNINQFDGEE